MTRMSLRALILSVLFVLCGAIALQGAVSLFAVHKVADNALSIAEGDVPSTQALGEAKYQITRLRLSGARLLLTSDPSTISKVQAIMAKLQDSAAATAKSLERLLDDDVEKTKWATFKARWAEYEVLARRAVEEERANQREAAVKTFNEAGTAFDASLEVLDQLSEFSVETARRNAESGKMLALWSTIGLVALLAAGLVVGFAASLLVRRRVVGPLAGITKAMGALAEGELGTPIPYADQSDEIGQMAGAVRVFKDKIVQGEELREQAAATQEAARHKAMAALNTEVGAVVMRAAEGDFSGRLDVDRADPELRELMTGINRINAVVDEATGDFAAVLSAVAEGDLTQTIAKAYRGRLEDLKDAINTTVARLSETVVTIQGTAQEVTGAAAEINSGSEDLARRTEQQASSLEETAATTEQLAASVKSSAAASRQAVHHAEEARRVAQEGGSIVANAVDAMSRIEQASQKISDITGVIDEIAFQTNLLALNAAVEAARAGDAGKGFAVVASEVRTLAQRSSEAAKDIGGLIQSSIAEVSQGVQLVREAGGTLGRIVGAADKVAATVSEISTAASEQANGIDEMSQAVAHMDEMTQQNAALAEESAASSNALRSQIETLNALVGQFRTGHQAGRRSHAGPAPRRVA